MELSKGVIEVYQAMDQSVSGLLEQCFQRIHHGIRKRGLLMANTELKKIKSSKRFRIKRILPLTPGWKGASILLAIATLCIYCVQAYFLMESRGIGDVLMGTFLSLLVIVLITGVFAGILHLAKRMPSRYVWIALASLCLLVICFIGAMPLGFVIALMAIVAITVLGALLYRWITGKYREAKLISKITTGVVGAAALCFIGISMYWLLDNGNPELAKPYTLKEMKPADRYQTTMGNPAQPGTGKVKMLTYGSADTYRKVFNQNGSLVTKPVNGSAFVDNWSSLRTKTFGFGPDRMPLNGLVWYPEGDGPFPLIVTVHGNHIATDYSDPGYEYLGELLASRGYIFVSIDENFLNISPYDDLLIINALANENPARGWLMLEHLKEWKAWNNTKGNPFFGKVDMSRIALIGHSRGGEAITVAAAYNKLTAYPEDANIAFDYNFGIRSIISIAGTDGQYKPAGQPTPLKDLNYLALQGAHDMDVNSFSTANQYSRIGFSQGSDYFKASVYIYGANHGQFNTVWGRKDSIGLNNKLFNTAQLIPQKEQLQASKVLISSFLDATLKGESEYRSIFQDIGYAREWLPDTMYIGNYMDSHTTLISRFDEDIDPGTTTLPGGRLVGEHLKKWKEEKVEMKFAPDLYSAVHLDWDQANTTGIPTYTVVMPDHGLHVEDNSSIVFAMADRDDQKEASGKEALTDISIKVEDKSGNVATVPLSSEAFLLPMFESRTVKSPFTSFVPTKEPVFQNFAFRMADLKKSNPNFHPEQLSKFSFVFDKTKKGSVLITDIGIRSDAGQTNL
ncbi:MFS transporter [Paenibacillus sp.]|uniref:MFS transporter n=1 Tax=Paenibacillus sp. TaxID=58172 RepID=UPI002837D519|nr:MFS transporter [Paenibacillus sp.]MDR0268314.1 MFS transporter [Paenibacillus sp.]